MDFIDNLSSTGFEPTIATKPLESIKNFNLSSNDLYEALLSPEP